MLTRKTDIAGIISLRPRPRAIGLLVGLITRRSEVRILPPLLLIEKGLAQKQVLFHARPKLPMCNMFAGNTNASGMDFV
jgi:hypothetical protein